MPLDCAAGHAGDTAASRDCWFVQPVMPRTWFRFTHDDTIITAIKFQPTQATAAPAGQSPFGGGGFRGGR